MVTASSLFEWEMSEYVWLKICESQCQLQRLCSIFVSFVRVCNSVEGEDR
jgi:hypothetical protein